MAKFCRFLVTISYIFVNCLFDGTNTHVPLGHDSSVKIQQHWINYASQSNRRSRNITVFETPILLHTTSTVSFLEIVRSRKALLPLPHNIAIERITQCTGVKESVTRRSLCLSGLGVFNAQIESKHFLQILENRQSRSIERWWLKWTSRNGSDIASPRLRSAI